MPVGTARVSMRVPRVTTSESVAWGWVIPRQV